MTPEQERELVQAQDKARQLLKAIEEKDLITIGSTEKQVSDRIYDLAFQMFGTKKHWHKRVVRTGKNTFFSYKVDPPDLPICQGDLVYLDLGPVFDNFEGDIGKTYLLGEDPVKSKLIQDLERIFAQGKEFYLDNPAMTGAQLWAKVLELTEHAGWGFGNNHAGHIVGEFSHIQRYGDSPEHRINALNHLPMHTPGADGLKRHWILEIHLVDKEGGFGGFFEDLISLPAT
ncbi:MAG: aminopeptidase [Candidatus Melainabacteria bacterium]|nr:MAG: aminopeptidase [Candidatus Melainabacteria bacterium]